LRARAPPAAQPMPMRTRVRVAVLHAAMSMQRGLVHQTHDTNGRVTQCSRAPSKSPPARASGLPPEYAEKLLVAA
jgi:hypothetical protein